MRKLFFCLTALLVLTSKELFAFSIEPARLEFVIPPGRQRGKSILIDNTRGDSPLHIKIYPQDVTYLPDGSLEFLPPGSTQWSCSGWIKVVPCELDIPAGKSKSVRVSVEVPAEAQGGGYAMLFFESGVMGSIKGIGVNFRLGATILVTVSGTENYKARLDNISFTKPKDIEVNIFNEGNLLIRPEGIIKIFDHRGKRIKSLDLNPNKLGILPQTLRKFNIQLDEPLPKGEYTLKAEIDFGQDYLLIGELPIEVE